MIRNANNCGGKVRSSSSIPRLVKVGGIRTGLRINFLRRLSRGSPHDADGLGGPGDTAAYMITSDICMTDGHASPGDLTADDRDAKLGSSRRIPKAAIFTLIGDCRVRIHWPRVQIFFLPSAVALQVVLQVVLQIMLQGALQESLICTAAVSTNATSTSATYCPTVL